MNLITDTNSTAGCSKIQKYWMETTQALNVEDRVECWVLSWNLEIFGCHAKRFETFEF